MAVPVTHARPAIGHDVEELEIDLLLEGIYQFLGADFRGYERAAIRRKLLEFSAENGFKTISSLQEGVMHDSAVSAAVLRLLTVQPSVLFGNVEEAAELRELIGPLLRSFVAPQVWLAECTNAEDIFSVAILLDEQGLLHKTRIYVTCSNQLLIQEMQSGKFDLRSLPEYQRNYVRVGGKRAFSDYWYAEDDRGVFSPHLAQHITWAQHDLSADFSFNEFQLIVCRKAMAAFGSQLRHRVLALFSESLSQFGILSVDREIDLSHAPFSLYYKALSREHGFYRRVG